MFNRTVTILTILVLFMGLILVKDDIFASTINATITTGIFEPSSPNNLASTVGDKNVDLSWSAPLSDGGSTIYDYIVEYKLTSGTVWSVFFDGIGVSTVVNVDNLSNDNSYDFRVSAVNSIGQGNPSTEVSSTPGSPAQVIVQGMSDLTITGIGANVRITNEGSEAYEYQYTWCVTDSEINLCGGGNDVSNSMAAKLVQPGENFDTTLNSVVPLAGNYWFHVSVQFGSDISYAIQSFTAVDETPPSGGGGGGGGGSSSSGSDIKIGSCNGADFNNDDKVNSIDFSIILAFWKTRSPFKNPCADVNRDNQVNSIDFSIMLYQWNKKPIPFK